MVASSSTRSVLLSPGTRLLDGFASAVSLHGSRDAVVDGEERLTYSELDAASDRLAAAVIAAAGQDAASFSGREPGRDQPVVGVLLPRSLANTAAWAGAAKAGFAYAPMSLEWPAERIRKVVERCSMQVVLSEPRYWDRPGLESVTLVDAAALLREGDVPDARRQSCPDGGASLPLYVIHTSGSTGEPKGVLVSHDNVFTVLSPAGEYGLTPGSRLLHNIAVTFDLAMMEVWGALLHGGTLIVTQTDTVLDAPRLKAHLERHEVDWALLPPAVVTVRAGPGPPAV